MKIKFTITLISMMLIATSSFAAERKSFSKETSIEEKRGAIAGAVVGAGVGGPLGAAVGAIIGGGVIGNIVGMNRINSELQSTIQEDAAAFELSQKKMLSEVKNLNSELTQMIKSQTASWNSRQLPVQFKTGSSDIEKHYLQQLNEIARILSRNLDTKVSLSGFSDRRGSEEYNLNLSQRRVDAVRSYLVNHGVRKNQIVADAFGESRPLKSDESLENNFFDRRVVMQFSFDAESYLATR